MNSFRRIVKDYRDSGALNSLLNVHAAVDQHTFLTKSGDLFCVLQAEGADYEGRDAQELEAVCRRFQAALRLFNEDYRIYQYWIKRSGVAVPHRSYPHHPVANAAVQGRIEFLQGRAAELHETKVYFVICSEGGRLTQSVAGQLDQFFRNPLRTLRQHFSVRASVNSFEEGLRLSRDRLAHKVDSFVAQMRESIQLSRLGKEEAFRFLRRLLTFSPEKWEGVRLKYDQFVDYQSCASHLECYRDHLRLDDHYVQVLTLKEPPARTFAHMLHALEEIPSDGVIVSEWKPVSNASVRRAIHSKRRHYHNSKSSFLNYVGATPTAPQDVLVDDSASALVRELGGCLEEVEVKGNPFGHFSMTLVLHAEDPARVKRAAAESLKQFAAHDAQLIEERYNLLNAYLAVIPGNHLYNRRRLWLSGANYADLSFLFTVYGGEARNGHLQAEYLAVLETDRGKPYFFNFHVQDVAHTLILGQTGSGKSFLVNFLLTHAQKYGPRTFIFDLGRGYEHLAKLFQGSVLALGPGKKPYTINPFVLPPTPENLRFLLAFFRVLIESNGYQMTAPEEKDLFVQIENLYSVDPAQRRLFTLSNVVGRNLRAQLGKWVEGGPYAWLFDHAEDTLTLSSFQVFDFEGMEKTPTLLEPLLFYVLHRASASVLDEERAATLKLFVLDEAWRFLRHPTIRNYVTEALKTWRKKNAAMILATQSTEDLLHTDMLEVVVESCPTKIFLANAGMNQEAYRRVFHLTETEGELIAGLTPKQQLIVKRPDRTTLLKLRVDPKGYWLYTSDPFDNQKKREAFERYGFEQGLETLARSAPCN